MRTASETKKKVFHSCNEFLNSVICVQCIVREVIAVSVAVCKGLRMELSLNSLSMKIQ